MYASESFLLRLLVVLVAGIHAEHLDMERNAKNSEEFIVRIDIG